MKISWGCNVDFKNMNTSNGYGYATEHTVASLRRLGLSVDYQDDSADVHIHFDQPHHFTPPRKDMYKIIFHPWESTILKPGWSDMMNECDEIWTPSPIIAEWYQKFAGVTRPVYVYEHGVDPIWKPHHRKVEGKFKFLHVGAEAARKGGTDTMKALRLAFPKNNDVELNLKIISKGWNIGQINRINILNSKLSINELIDLFHNNHAYVYPSWGEGFGLTPLQAMATGMPTITVPDWAPYARFLNPNISVGSRLDKSQWPRIHPGMMLRPSMDDLVESMRYAYDNYEAVEADAQERVSAITEYYDWDRLTKNTFDLLEKRLQK